MGVASSASFQNDNSSLIDFFHGAQVAMMTTVMTNLTQFIWHANKARRADALDAEGNMKRFFALREGNRVEAVADFRA
eukprot:gene10750-9253_t